MLNDLRQEVVVRFIIGSTVDHHCLNFLFIILDYIFTIYCTYPEILVLPTSMNHSHMLLECKHWHVSEIVVTLGYDSYKSVGCRGRNVVGFTTTCAISASHHISCEFDSCSWQGVLNTTLCDKVGQWFSQRYSGFLHQ